VASLDAGLEILGHHSAGIVALDVGSSAIMTLGSNLELARWDRLGHMTLLAEEIYCATLIGDLAISISKQGDVTATDGSARVRWRAQRAVAGVGTRCGIAGSFSGRLVATFGKTAMLWDIDSGRPRGELAPSGEVSAVAFAADGTHVATGEVGGAVRIWDAATAALVASCEPHKGMIRDIKFTADQRSVVTGGNDGEVRVCDAATGATVHRMIGHSHQVLAVDVTSDGRTVVSSGRDGKPRIWDARTGLLVRVLEGHRGTVMSTQLSPDGEQILTLGSDGTARIWNREGMALGSLQGHGGPIYAGRWDHDGQHVITTSVDGAVRSWDPKRAQKTALRHAHTGAISDLAVSRDDRWVLTASADGRTILWDRPSLRVITELPHPSKVSSVRFGPDGATALTTDVDGNARLWQLPTGSLIAKLASNTNAAIYTRDGRIITAGEGEVRFWTVAGRELAVVPLDYAADRLVLDPAERWLFVTGATSALSVIDTSTRQPRARLAIHDRQVLAVASDESHVAVTDGAVLRLWQLGTWIPVGVLTGHKNPVSDVWFLPDGQLVSAAGDGTLVWDRDTRLRAKLADTNYVFALAASPDGTFFATTGSDGAIRIWDTASYRMLLQLPAHGLPAMALQLTHDGATAVSGGNDGRLVISDLARQARSAFELAAIVRCRVPLQLDGDIVLPRDLDFDDPACRGLKLDR
jgi:WD40 repeat protein